MKEITTEQIEGNILIAEFMGWKFQAYKGNSSYDQKYSTYKKCEDAIRRNKWDGYTPQIGWKIGVGKYHESWDWLMEAVEKIESQHHRTFPIIVNISGDGAVIAINPSDAGGNKYEGKREIANTLNCNYFNDYPGADRCSKIEAVWSAVVQYIKWHNENLALNASQKENHDTHSPQ